MKQKLLAIVINLIPIALLVGLFATCWQIALVFFGHWYLSLLAQSLFHHRYAAHGMFRMPRWMEKAMIAFTWISMGSSYINHRAYAVLHTMHHDFSDSETDPHSPHYSSNIFTMMWKTKQIYTKILRHPMFFRKYLSYLQRGRWPLIEAIAESWASRIFWILTYVAGYLLLIHFCQLSWWWMALLPIHFMMSPIHGALVNWFGHKLGYRNHKEEPDHSVNSLPIDVVCGGELFQNNHHHRGNKIYFGDYWWEIDPIGFTAKCFMFCGLFKPAA